MAPPSISVAPHSPFQYVSGDLSLDLVNTVDWTGRGLENDRLLSYDHFARWAEGAGMIAKQTAERLRRAAAVRPREAEAAYEATRWLRWVLQRLFVAVAKGTPPDAALRDFNDLLAEAYRRLQLVTPDAGSRRQTIHWAWRDAGVSLESELWPIVRAAAELLTSEEAIRIRVCAGPDCGWMYVDRSRNGLRRWCQMETCGTREKSRRRARRARRAAR